MQPGTVLLRERVGRGALGTDLGTRKGTARVVLFAHGHMGPASSFFWPPTRSRFKTGPMSVPTDVDRGLACTWAPSLCHHRRLGGAKPGQGDEPKFRLEGNGR